LSYQTIGRKRFEKLIREDYLDLIDIPAILFHPYRMLIMQALILHGNVEFRQLKYAIPEMTDGNLASHLRVLERSGYVHCHKEIVDRKLRTSYEITENGRKSFERLKQSLRKMVGNEPNI
jgi:DNA-binding HxlR family transcriptional regulator